MNAATATMIAAQATNTRGTTTAATGIIIAAQETPTQETNIANATPT